MSTEWYLGWDLGGPDRTVISPTISPRDESFFGDAELVDRFGACAGIGEVLRTLLVKNKLPLEGYAFLRAEDGAGWYLVKREVAMCLTPGATIVMVQ